MTTLDDHPAEWQPAQFGVRSADRIRCELCPHLCELAAGQTGVCHLRRNRADILETAVVGTAVRHYGPIERKPLYHFRPGLDILTLAAPGCTFACAYCQNYRLSQFGREPAAFWRLETFDIDETVAAAHARGAGIAFSYSEPALAAELTIELAARAQPLGVPLVWKTNGFLTARAVDRLGPCLAAVNIDIKASDERRHRALTGASLAPIWETLERFRGLGVWVEVSTPLIPRISHTDEALSAIASRISHISPDIPWHILRFNPEFRMPNYLPSSTAALEKARTIGLDMGLRHVYVERALGATGRSTSCPTCGEVVIIRDIWAVSDMRLQEGRCAACGSSIAGVWA